MDVASCLPAGWRRGWFCLWALLATGLAPVLSTAQTSPDPDSPESLAEQVTRHYVKLAHFRYADSMDAAMQLHRATLTFLNDPGETTHAAVKQAWIEAHSVYSHTEVLRFGNPNVDAWEPKVNAWPMDEGLIDYVAEGYVFHEGNPHAVENLVAKGEFPINDELLAEYRSGTDPKAGPVTTITDIESNVTTGYHAVEFLLWGQDLNAEPGDSGKRSHDDFVVAGDPDLQRIRRRRRDYLSAAVRLIISDLRFMLADWQPDGNLYAKRFQELPVEERLHRMILGAGGMSFAELGVERMRVALMTCDQEEEQSCFSDATHLAIYHNAKSIETLYLGTHRNRRGEVLEGPSLSDLVRQVDLSLDKELKDAFRRTNVLATAVLEAGEKGEHFDQMILANNHSGRQRLLDLIEQLQRQTMLLEKLQIMTNQLAQH